MGAYKGKSKLGKGKDVCSANMEMLGAQIEWNSREVITQKFHCEITQDSCTPHGFYHGLS